MPAHEILLRSVARRWRTAVQSCTGRVLLLSPYLSPRTAERIIDACDPARCEIYTLFSVENFSAGASSLRTLRRLLERGFELYHLAGLHAKIVVAPDKFVSIGSQNLTERGTYNREASVIFNGGLDVSSVMEQLKPWLTSRVSISAEMVTEAEAIVAQLAHRVRAVRREADAFEEAIWQAERARDAARQRADAAAAAKAAARARAAQAQRMARLHTSVARLPRAGQSVLCEVRHFWSSDRQSSTYSLTRVQAGSTLTSWRLGAQAVSLKRSFRYLCIVEDTGKLGWARVMKTRITYFATGVKYSSTVEILGTPCRVSAEAMGNAALATGVNLRLVLVPKSMSAAVRVDCWFTIDGLEVVRIAQQGRAGGAHATAIKAFIHAISHDPKSWAAKLVPELTRPFKFQQNLYGNQANQFLGRRGNRYHLSLAKGAETTLLLITP